MLLDGDDRAMRFGEHFSSDFSVWAGTDGVLDGTSFRDKEPSGCDRIDQRVSGSRGDQPMRAIMFAAVLAAGAFAGTSAFAQHEHHAFCMKTAGGLECAYDSFQQCQAAVKGANDSCMPNSAPQEH
jgi:hypothetical protein